ncbi:MAG: type II toxin-antitoxin system RelB/DinJ family antitoxin [Lachnospiraceae bacterium]|nr:type II toxin-antitoxin system RelB/DinJ family antitoxin [Lachnospiraceae bacterium]
MSTISVRLNPKDKTSFEDFCSSVGMSVSTAVSLFVKNVINNQKLPFTIERDPFYSEENMAHLAKVIEDIESGKAKLTEHELIEV